MTELETSEKIDNLLKSMRWAFTKNDIINLFDTFMHESEEKISLLLNIEKEKRTFANTIEIFEEIIPDRDDNGDIYILANASTDSSIRQEAINFTKKVLNYKTDLLHRMDLFKAVDDYVQNNYKSEKSSLVQIEVRLTEKIILEFKRVGHGLPFDKQERLKLIDKELNNLELAFNSRLNEENTTVPFTLDELDGVPLPKVNSFPKDENNNYLVSLKNPDVMALLTFAKKFETRKKIQFFSSNKGLPENPERMKKAIVLRKEYATLLGYNNYADYILEIQMAKNSKNVEIFLDDIKNKLKNFANKQIEYLEAIKREDKSGPQNETFYSYDLFYYANIYQQKILGTEMGKIQEYFPMEHVIEKMLEYYQIVFHLTFILIENVQTWHTDVITYAVFNKSDDDFIGIFFLDLYPREGKYGWFASFKIKKGVKSKIRREYPISAILANFPKPTEDKPTLLIHRDVITLFHEFGHIIHQLLGSTAYRRSSGTSVSKDFVEAPSQILENWVFEKSVLKKITSHYKTKESLPDELIEKLIKSSKLFLLFNYMNVLLAILDLNLHTKDIENPVEYWYKLQNESLNVKGNENGNFMGSLLNFMSGYQASYYGFTWSIVISDDIYKTKFKKDPMSEKNGLEYRQKVLELGGSIDEDVLIQNYLGRKFTDEAFIEKFQQ